ncbi:hypothetical protein INR49_020328 [Caranx melampygus]|nr:hypothetical protein INR49_020328 [Caranx melampygus]
MAIAFLLCITGLSFFALISSSALPSQYKYSLKTHEYTSSLCGEVEQYKMGGCSVIGLSVIFWLYTVSYSRAIERLSVFHPVKQQTLWFVWFNKLIAVFSLNYETPGTM